LRVAVVGAGVSGSAAAALLSRAGLTVKLLDMSPRYVKPCGEVVPAETLGHAERCGLPRPPLVEPISSFVFVDASRSTVRRFDFGYPVWYSIDKGGWVEALQAQAGGVEARPVRSPERLAREAKLDLVVDARGPFGGRGVRIPVWRAYTRNTGLDAAVLVFHGSRLGFAWAFPHGDSLNIGAGFLGVREPRSLGLRLLHRAFQLLSLKPPDDGLRGAYSLVTVLPSLDLGSPRLPRVGEAAGLIYAPGGEGIRPALLSGCALAQAYTREEDVERAFRRYLGAVQPLVDEVRVARLALLAAAPAAGLVPRLLESASPRYVEAWLSGRIYRVKLLLEAFLGSALRVEGRGGEERLEPR